jgi:pSer/pThr/pTyr-binding forkhead associated (FHA) protein
VLEIHGPAGVPWIYPFYGGVARIGRGQDNDVVLLDDRASRHHGQVTMRQGTLVYTDLGSTNGSWVNGAAVQEIALGAGDAIRVGDTTLIVRPGG